MKDEGGSTMPVTLETLAVTINAEHAAGEAAMHKGLEHYRRCGEALLKAKKL
jgi:hypothetical protein